MMTFVKIIGLALLTIPNAALLNSQQSLPSLINETNAFLSSYDDLSPFNYEPDIPVAATGLPAATIAAIKADENYVDGLSPDKDSISEFNLLLEFQGLIMENIQRITAHKEFANFQPEALLDNDALSIIVSDDQKLYNFSLDEKTGGTHRSRISLTHYTEIGQDLLPTPEALELGSKTDPYAVFEGDGFDAIYTIKAKEGTKYVLTGSVRGCSYCFETNVMLVHFTDTGFQSDFYYSVNSRSWEEGVSYDPSTKIITVDYFTDDLTVDCGCSNAAEDGYYYNDDAEEEFTKQCHCTFEFDGSNFVLVKESWEKVKE